MMQMTANAFSESADECFASGMDSFVPKPITFQKIKERLEQYLPDWDKTSVVKFMFVYKENVKKQRACARKVL